MKDLVVTTSDLLNQATDEMRLALDEVEKVELPRGEMALIRVALSSCAMLIYGIIDNYQNRDKAED